MNNQPQESSESLRRFPQPEDFQTQIQGKQVWLHSLNNKNGIQVCITNYGGRIISILVPDKEGVFADVVAGFSSIHGYINAHEAYHGAIIGRYANRIAGATFRIDNQEYHLTVNNGPNTLHGGPGGFHNVVWESEQVSENKLVLSYLSPHLEEGFPGNLRVSVTYMLDDHNQLHMEYRAVTDQKTIINLTNHAFFNLNGEGSNTINYHILKINADAFLPVNENLIPIGNSYSVENTPFDFREFTPIAARLENDHDQLILGRGYDHTFVLNRPAGPGNPFLAASIYDPASLRQLDVLTTEPGIQLYGGNFLNGSDTGKKGEPYHHRSSFCLETQHFPDSPNQPGFPSTLLKPGEEFISKTIYKFSVHQEF
jgi:aldose 1-epimerase